MRALVNHVTTFFSGIGVADASGRRRRMLLLAPRVTSTTVSKGTGLLWRDGKYEGVVYAFDGLGVGGADANNRALLVSVMSVPLLPMVKRGGS